MDKKDTLIVCMHGKKCRKEFTNLEDYHRHLEEEHDLFIPFLDGYIIDEPESGKSK